MIIFFLLSVSLAFFNLPSVFSLAEGDSCVTPNNERTICKQIGECPVIALTLTGSPSLEHRTFASKSYCGRTRDNKIVVCCGSSALPITNTKQGTTDPLAILQHRLLPKPDICGLQSIDNKIAYGKETRIKEFPWMALLFYTEPGNPVPINSCGGSLINKRYVLTAAHCIKTSYGRELVSVRLGEHNIETDTDCDNGVAQYKLCNPAAIDYGIQTSVIHDGYRKKNMVNDIGLIRLNRDVDFTEHIRPICLPSSPTPHPAGKNVTAAGWGENEIGLKSQVKLKATLVAIGQSECVNLFANLRAVINDNQYCARGFCQNGLKCTDTCKGDSGGPSVRINSQSTQSQWIIEGITSYGPPDCATTIPAVYTRVSQYADWIVNNMID